MAAADGGSQKQYEKIHKEEQEAIQADRAIKEIALIRKTFGEATAQAYVKSKHEEGNSRAVLIQDALDAGYTRDEITTCFNSSKASVVDVEPELTKQTSPPPTTNQPKVKYHFPGAGRAPCSKTMTPWRGPLPKP